MKLKIWNDVRIDMVSSSGIENEKSIATITVNVCVCAGGRVCEHARVFVRDNKSTWLVCLSPARAPSSAMLGNTENKAQNERQEQPQNSSIQTKLNTN